MTAVLADPPVMRGGAPEGSRPLFGSPGGEPVLDALVSGVWERLVARGAAACPACGGRLEAVYAVAAIPVEGRCVGCGAVLS